jgi:hypothetical protein
MSAPTIGENEVTDLLHLGAQPVHTSVARSPPLRQFNHNGVPVSVAVLRRKSSSRCRDLSVHSSYSNEGHIVMGGEADGGNGSLPPVVGNAAGR